MEWEGVFRVGNGDEGRGRKGKSWCAVWVEEGSIRVSDAGWLRSIGKISAGREVLRLPMEMVMSSPSVNKILAERGWAKEEDAEVGMALALLCSGDDRTSTVGQSMIWADSTRGKTWLPLEWDDATMQSALAGSDALPRLRALRDQVEEEFRNRRDWIPWSLDEFIWARALVRARAVWDVSKDIPCLLAPMISQMKRSQADSFESCAGAAQVGITAVGFFREPSVRLVSRSACPPETDLVLPGPRASCDLFVQQGFLMEYDDVNVGLSFAVSSMDPFFDDKEDILENYSSGSDLSAEETLFLVNSSGEGIPFDLMAYVRLVCLCPPDAFLLEPVFRGEIWDFMQLPVSRENEEMALNEILAVAELRVESYPSEELSYEHNEALEGARRLIEGEKAALKKIIQMCELELQLLDGKEYYQERRLRELDLLRPIEACEVTGDSEASVRARKAFDDYS